MKTKFLILCVIAAGLSVRAATQNASTEPAPTNAAATPDTNSAQPKIQFAETTYEFGRVTSGTQVKHSFVFTNIGDATLEIISVVPGCGCTTVGEWTHKVEPGKTGFVGLNFNSTGYNGEVRKAPHITCNDKTQPSVTLQLHGSIYRPVDIKPPFVTMNIGPDSDGHVTATAHIVSNEDKPITVSGITSSLRSFTAEVSTNGPATNFDLTIKTIPPLELGNNQAVISVQTSSTNVPQLNIIALAIVRPPVASTPEQIVIPPGPVQSNETFAVSIVNQGTKPISLSSPEPSVKGIDANLKTTQPGLAYVATVEVPQGFQIPPGQSMYLALKTDHPRFPEIRIPITQSVAAAPVNPQPTAVPIRTQH